jgi:hypothetical protein
LKFVEKWGMGGKGQGRTMEGAELTEVKYTHSGNTSGNPFELDFGINNKSQDCKISTVGVRGVYGKGESGWRR